MTSYLENRDHTQQQIACVLTEALPEREREREREAFAAARRLRQLAGCGSSQAAAARRLRQLAGCGGFLLTFCSRFAHILGAGGRPGGPAAAALQCPGQSSGCQPNQAPRFGAYRKIATLYFDFSPGFPHEKRQFGHACDLL